MGARSTRELQHKQNQHRVAERTSRAAPRHITTGLRTAATHQRSPHIAAVGRLQTDGNRLAKLFVIDPADWRCGTAIQPARTRTVARCGDREKSVTLNSLYGCNVECIRVQLSTLSESASCHEAATAGTSEVLSCATSPLDPFRLDLCSVVGIVFESLFVVCTSFGLVLLGICRVFASLILVALFS